MSDPLRHDANPAEWAAKLQGEITSQYGVTWSAKLRDDVVAQIGAAWAADVIPEPEMERRMQAAYAARERADLERLVADLPAPHALAPLPGAAAPPAPRGLQLSPLRRVVFSSIDDRVRSTVPARVEFGARFGSIEMDFTEAIFAHAVTEIVVDAVFSNIELTLPAHVAVESDVHGIFSNVESHQPDVMTAPSSHTVRITGRALFGNVEVRVARDTRRVE